MWTFLHRFAQTLERGSPEIICVKSHQSVLKQMIAMSATAKGIKVDDLRHIGRSILDYICIDMLFNDEDDEDDYSDEDYDDEYSDEDEYLPPPRRAVAGPPPPPPPSTPKTPALPIPSTTSTISTISTISEEGEEEETSAADHEADQQNAEGEE